MEQHHTLKQHYRAKEAAIYLGVNISTIWRYSQLGKLNPIKLSPRITVFKKSDLDRLISTGDHR